jgi:hypothetical protein
MTACNVGPGATSLRTSRAGIPDITVLATSRMIDIRELSL